MKKKWLVFTLFIFGVLCFLSSCSIHFHDWQFVQISQIKTCTNNGTMIYRCSTCNKTKIEVIKADGHDLVVEKGVEPDCYNTGLTDQKSCRICGEVIVKAEMIIPKHDFDGQKPCNKCGTAYYTEGLYIVSNGSTCSVEKYQGTDSTVIIPRTYQKKDITRISSRAFADNKYVQNVVLPTTLNYIENSAFASCSNLKEITIPHFVDIIYPYAFSGCSSLENVILPAHLTSISKGAFKNCVSLENINLPNSIRYIEMDAFNGCTSLQNVNFNKYLETIGDYAFNNCYNLTEVSLPETLYKIGNYAFYNCSSLINLGLSENLTKIGNYAFAYCEQLVDLEITSSVKEIGDFCFSYCKNVISIVVPSSVTKLGKQAFSYCTSLTELYLPDSIESIGVALLYGSENIQTINLPYIGVDRANSGNYGINSYFNIYNTTTNPIPVSLSTIIVRGEVLSTNAIVNMEGLKCLILKEGVSRVDSNAIKDCLNLEFIVIENENTIINDSMYSNIPKANICLSFEEIPSTWGESWNEDKLTIYYPSMWEYDENNHPVLI